MIGFWVYFDDRTNGICQWIGCKKDKGKSSRTPWHFLPEELKKKNRITIKQVGTYSIKASFRKKIRSSDLDI